MTGASTPQHAVLQGERQEGCLSDTMLAGFDYLHQHSGFPQERVLSSITEQGHWRALVEWDRGRLYSQSPRCSVSGDISRQDKQQWCQVMK